MTINYPLTIGSISLSDNTPGMLAAPFEGPNGDQGGLSDLGSRQKAVVREFPGGIITAQLYGSFPKTITWSGKLFGNTAISRSFELQKLCDNGQEVQFNWAQWSYDGFVEDYEVTARGPNEIDYRIVYRTLVNNSTVSGGNQLASNDPFAGTVSNAQNTMQQQAATPASGYTMPTPITGGVTALNQSINQALQQTGGSVAQIPPATLTTLQGQISALQNQLSPIISGIDPIGSSAAADLNGTLGVLHTAFNNSLNPLITTIQASNPNIYQLAAQYYGDPTLYWVITSANGITDPLPTTNGPISLKIPIKPSIAPSTISTVMTDALSAA